MALGGRGAKVGPVDIDQEGAQLVAENIRGIIPTPLSNQLFQMRISFE